MDRAISGFRDWAGLPADLLTCIGELLTIAGRVRFRGVCRSWSAALSAMPSPWLLIPPHPHDHVDGDHTFLSLPANRSFRRALPAGMFCVGSSAGWLALADVSLNILLLNPLTDAQVRLPPLRRRGRLMPLTYAPDGSVSTFFSYPPLLGAAVPADLQQIFEIQKVAFSPEPSEEDYVVAVLCRLWHGLAFTRADSDGWNWVEWPLHHLNLHVPAHHHDYDLQDLLAFDEQTAPYRGCNYHLDIVYHDGKFYYMTVCGRIWVLDAGGNGMATPTLLPTSPGAGRDVGQHRKYLVFSDGMLHLVCIGNGMRCIERVDGGRRGELVRGLGGHAFLVGKHSQSVSVSPSGSWLRPDCIYYTSVASSSEDVSELDVKSLSRETCNDSARSSSSELNWLTAMWFTPSLH